MRYSFTSIALVVVYTWHRAIANCGKCDLSGAWNFFGGQGKEIYAVNTVHDGSFTGERISNTGSWKSAAGSMNGCDITIKFSTGKLETGTLSADCSSISWSDKSQWSRIVPDICSKLGGPYVNVVESQGSVALGNGYTCIIVDLQQPRISSLRADFSGSGSYGANVLSSTGFVLEREDTDGTIHSSAAAGAATVQVVTNTSTFVQIVVSGIADAAGEAAAVTDTWTISLKAGARSVLFSSNGSLRRAIVAKAMRYTMGFMPTSIYALFDRGVVQMMAAASPHDHYASADGISRLYALGGHISVAMRRNRSDGTGVVLLSSAANGVPVSSGFQEVLGGQLPETDTWSAGWGAVKPEQLTAGMKWTVSYELAPNNFDFPVQGPFGDLTTDGNIPDTNLQAMLTGIYGSPVGQLCTHDNGVVKGQHVAQMATTIAHPDYGYQGNYNFFDPDNYVSTSALLFSGDPYLQEQVRLVLERNGDLINEKGQLPHHIGNVTPTYQALSGETQTGPNVFWILSCLTYAKATGNLDWLVDYMPKLRIASNFLFEMIQPDLNLLKSPGSLMIDVFIRNNFTTDTNAMVVGFLHEFADAEEATGNTTGAAHLRGIASSIAQAIDALLFNNETGDHYVTQLNPDGSMRDFVDYDANFIALAHGIPSSDRANKVFNRIDSAKCAHGRATFVSEKYYGKNDTTDGNIGDSWCTMGRIGWFDALARKRYGDQHTFDSLLLDPLIDDVNRWTWLHERYDCDGNPQTGRTSYYFEYPSVTAMMIHFVRYGIQLGFNSVIVTPFGPKSFKYHVGAVNLEYNAGSGSVVLSVPGKGVKDITIAGLTAGEMYISNVGKGPSVAPWPAHTCGVVEEHKATASKDGVLTFKATVGDRTGPCVITVKVPFVNVVV